MSDTPFQAPSPEHLAELLPQFDIEFFIAQGGMGAVYKGRQRSLDRDVAVKVLPKEIGANEEFRDSFNTEAKAMAKLNHPNLLGVFDFGSVDGMPYIVMEYVEGGSLYEACHEQAVDPQQAVAIVKGICDGLANAHEHDIVHRDIKPANILLTEKVEPKVADFGLAQALDSDQPGLVMGTPGYTAPEVFQDPDQAGKLADIYSVGVILHQLLTGIDPSGQMEPPTKPVGNIRLDSIWRKATNIVPTQRYDSVDAMAKDLEKWLNTSRPQAAAGAAAPYRPPAARPVAVAGSGGGGMGMKIFLILLLGIGVLVTFQVLNKRKDGIEKKNADNAAKPKVEVVQLDPKPDVTPDEDPGPEVTDNVNSSPLPELDPDPIKINIPDNDPPEIVDNDPVEEEPEELEPGDPELRKTAVGLIGKEIEARNAELTENVRRFVFQLGIKKRDADPDEVSVIDTLERRTTEMRVPRPHTIGPVPSSIVADFQHAIDKQNEIDTKFLSSLANINSKYKERLEAAASETSDETLGKKLKAQAGRAEDLEKWVNLLVPGGVDFGEKEKAQGEGGAAPGKTVELGRPPEWLKQATNLAWTGHPQDFARFRSDLLNEVKGTDNPRFATFAAKAACIRPIDEKAVQSEVLKLAQMAFDADGGVPSFRIMLLGMAQYRSGEFTKALATLETVDLEWPPVALATNYYEVLCMAKQGGDDNLEKARALFDETEDSMPPVPDDEVETHAPDRLLMWLAYKEAKELLTNQGAGNEGAANQFSGNTGFEGKWRNIYSDNEGKYVAHPGGRLEVVGQTWKVSWKILEDGTLEIDWNKKKPDVYTKDEATGRWVGETGFGKKSVLVPGDW